MTLRLAHVCISATDLAATKQFYCEALGFEKAFDFLRDDRVVGFYLCVPDGGYVEVFQRDAIALKTKSPILHFCLEVDDIDALARRLAGHGCEVTEKKLGADRSWQIWTTDPNGVRIEIQQYTPQSSQVTREDCLLSSPRVPGNRRART